MINHDTYQPVKASQRTPGRWQIGDGPDAHELTSGDLIEFIVSVRANARARRGRVEHSDECGYVVISANASVVPMMKVCEAYFLGHPTP